MRSLVQEKTYESLRASGKYLYFQDGQKTGIVESWRMTNAVNGHSVLRTDFDGRDAKKDSLLTHWVFDPQGKPQRVMYRWITPLGRAMAGNLLFDSNEIVNSWQDDTGSYHQQTILQAPLGWGTAVGVSRLASAVTVAPVAWFGGDDWLDATTHQLHPTVVTTDPIEDSLRLVVGSFSPIDVWMNQWGWAEKVSWSNGIEARAKRQIFL